MHWLNYASDVTAVQWGVVLGASLAAALNDLRSRRIPNRLTMPLALLGLAVAFFLGGWSRLGSSAAAWLILALPYILLFFFAGGGAGDAKMMGAIGTWLGLEAGLVVLVAVAIVGGLLGLAGLIMDRQQDSRIGNLLASLYVITIALAGGRRGWTLLAPPEPGAPGPAESRRGTIPYGPAIFIGACIGAWVVYSWRL
jgi:prepilin peptidase CpaA